MFSNETSFQEDGHPRKNCGFPLMSCAMSSMIAVTDAHIPSICIISSPGASPEMVKRPEFVPLRISEKP
jgi:hypothetical protein